MVTPTERTIRLGFDSRGQRDAARRALEAAGGASCRPQGERGLSIHYDLARMDRAGIDAVLAAAGIERRTGPLGRLGGWAARYFEAVQWDLARSNPGWSGAVRSAYISHYRARRHGRRDDRPQQWRRYVREEPDPPST